TGQGFDACFAPSVPQMQNWFANSPYRAVNLYVGGGSLYPGCTALTAPYVAQLAQQGWQLIPTWVGPQAPCFNSQSLPKFSGDPATAFNQGVGEADAAVERSASLGLTAVDRARTILYYDLE